MAWRKSPQVLIDTFNAVLPKDERAQSRKMFGYPCCFVNGNMFTGLHQENLIVRLPERQRERLLRVDGAVVFEPMAGRPMSEYVTVPPTMLANKRQLRSWVKKAFDYGLTLPGTQRKLRARGGDVEVRFARQRLP